RRRRGLVEVDVGREGTEPERQAMGDEVDLVATLGERQPELGRDNAAAPEVRVAGDADPTRLPPPAVGDRARATARARPATAGCLLHRPSSRAVDSRARASSIGTGPRMR